jgi:lipopolysaccharide/colanic/teichoic acid biosynthesis glycosyltransferase
MISMAEADIPPPAEGPTTLHDNVRLVEARAADRPVACLEQPLFDAASAAVNAPAVVAIVPRSEAHPLALSVATVSVDPVSIIPEELADEALEFISDYSTRARLAVKRLVDIVLSTIALMVLLPLFLVIAAAIKFADGGPIFFAQHRVGFRGQTFLMLKFRSMLVYAEALRPRLEIVNESNGPVFKMRRDPRVTPVGRVLRKYSLDELPQLINVLLGHMSLVGPRPSLATEVARYEPWHLRRFAVRPGLTCLWQVCASRYQMRFEDWIRLDLDYVNRWSLRLDFRLIMRTFRVVFSGTGE